MAFAQPLALFFFFLAIPIVLLYLLKQRRRRVQVSTLMFWDQILRDEQSVTSITRLRKLLSLLLQLLVVTLLALALARPVLSSDLLGARRLVIFLDTSASMTAVEGDTTRFELAKNLALDVVRNMSIGDSAMLVTVAGTPDIVVPLTDSRKELQEAIDATQVTHAPTHFAPAVALLNNLPPDERETAVYLITDGAFDPVELSPSGNMAFAYLPVGNAQDNVGITVFQLRPLPASPRDFEIMFEAVNNTNEERQVPYELRVADRMIDAGELTMPPNGAVSRSVRQFSQEGGEVELVLDYDDALPLDNRAYAVLPRHEPFHVVLVTPGNLFLESALLTDEEIDLTTMAPADFLDAENRLEHPLDRYTFVFDGWTPETAPDVNAIYAGYWPKDVDFVSEGNLDDPLIVDWERDHPINRHLYLTNVSIQNARRISGGDSWQSLMQSVEGPLSLYQETEDRKTLVLAFDTRSSDLPLRVAFPILVANAIRHMAGSEQNNDWQSPEVGAIFSREDVEARRTRAWHAEDAERAYAVFGPDDALPPTEGDTPFVGRNWEDDPLLALNRVGIYRLVEPGAVVEPLLAVNLNSARESSIKTPLKEIEGGLRFGAEPWLLLATIAIVFLVFEWFLFHRRWIE